MTTIKYKTGDRLTMRVWEADNVMTAYMVESDTSRRKIYERMTDYAPKFKDKIDLGPSIRGDVGEVVVTATNFRGTGQVVFLFEVAGKEVHRVTETLKQHSSKTWLVTFQKG